MNKERINAILVIALAAITLLIIAKYKPLFAVEPSPECPEGYKKISGPTCNVYREGDSIYKKCTIKCYKPGRCTNERVGIEDDIGQDSGTKYYFDAHTGLITMPKDRYCAVIKSVSDVTWSNTLDAIYGWISARVYTRIQYGGIIKAKTTCMNKGGSKTFYGYTVCYKPSASAEFSKRCDFTTTSRDFKVWTWVYGYSKDGCSGSYTNLRGNVKAKIIMELYRYIPPETKEVSDKVRICTDECSKEDDGTCDGHYYITCEEGSNGCYEKEKRIVVGKCGVECKRDSDCGEGYYCEDYECVQQYIPGEEEGEEVEEQDYVTCYLISDGKCESVELESCEGYFTSLEECEQALSQGEEQPEGEKICYKVEDGKCVQFRADSCEGYFESYEECYASLNVSQTPEGSKLIIFLIIGVGALFMLIMLIGIIFIIKKIITR